MVNNVYPLVTIGIPTYNRADGYLKQALQSAVDQTYPRLEIVVSDNCSTDQTDLVVKGFSDPRIRYFKHSENIGANNNFNFCLEQARGDYFLLLHDDDLIDKDFVQLCLASVNYNTELGIIRTGTRLINSQTEVMKEVPNMVGGLATEDFFRGWFTRKTALYLCSTLFNTKRLREIGGFKSKKNLFQDVVAEFQLAAKFGRADIPEVKASFRKHADEITYSAKVGDWCEDSLMLLDLMCELVSENKALIRYEGKRYFAKKNYMRAGVIKSFRERLAACLLVFKMFNYRYPPPLSILFPGNPISRAVRYLKRRTQKPDNPRLPFSPQRS
jgi:glycosyltransferase involved in cell wall biosynthesis